MVDAVPFAEDVRSRPYDAEPVGRFFQALVRIDLVLKRFRTAFVGKLHLGGDCWIGNSSVIMADIGEASVIGAGSVVVKPIPPLCVAVGNPATVKKRRTTADRNGDKLPHYAA